MRNRIQFIALAPLLLAINPLALVAGAPAENATEKFSELETRAKQIKTEAAKLETFARFPELYSPKLHEGKLLGIKADVNKMGDIVSELHQNRPNLARWQDQLLNRVLDKMSPLADSTDAAIQFVDKKPERLFKPNYEVFVADIQDESAAIARSVDAFLDWANAKAEKRELTQISSSVCSLCR